jgi:carbon-monoxide dehydrogenase medium subunit
MPAAILALDAVMIAASLQGSNGTSSTTTREIAAGDFFVDLLTSALEPGEILTTIRLPKLPQGAGSAYVKIRNKASHYALVGVAVVLGLDGDGTCSHASVAITGAGAHAFRDSEVENALKGTKLESGDISNAAGKAGSGADINWMADLFGSAEYRQHLAHVATARAINTALERARKG